MVGHFRVTCDFETSAPNEPNLTLRTDNDREISIVFFKLAILNFKMPISNFREDHHREHLINLGLKKNQNCRTNSF